MTQWLDKQRRPVFRLSPDEAWPLPLFTPGQVTPVAPARAESRVVVPMKGRAAGG